MSIPLTVEVPLISKLNKIAIRATEALISNNSDCCAISTCSTRNRKVKSEELDTLISPLTLGRKKYNLREKETLSEFGKALEYPVVVLNNYSR